MTSASLCQQSRQTKTFIVTTAERVEGRYEVEATSEAEARAKFDDKRRLIDWTGVEQIDYMAYEVAVESVEAPDA